MGGPLEGLKVLDIATIIAAPLAATLLADYGAEVLKIEMPGQGDGSGPFRPSRMASPCGGRRRTATRNSRRSTFARRKGLRCSSRCFRVSMC